MKQVLPFINYSAFLRWFPHFTPNRFRLSFMSQNSNESASLDQHQITKIRLFHIRGNLFGGSNYFVQFLKDFKRNINTSNAYSSHL